MLKNVLVCDDNKGILEALKLILENEYNLFLISNPNEIIETIKNNHIELILLDYHFDGITGNAILKKIRAFNPTVKVIMITAYVDESEKIIAKELGVIEFIGKPFKALEVIDILKKALS